MNNLNKHCVYARFIVADEQITQEFDGKFVLSETGQFFLRPSLLSNCLDIYAKQNILKFTLHAQNTLTESRTLLPFFFFTYLPI